MTNRLDLVKPKPFLKWAGGKRSLLSEILPRVPEFSGRYIEPFLGAGAVMFALTPKNGILANDFNKDLIEVYTVIRDDLDNLMSELALHVNEKEHFLSVRAWDRMPDFQEFSAAKRAARFIYLNKTCFNGLYRVNSEGFFNVPFGNYKQPDFSNLENLLAVRNFLESNVELTSGDYREASKSASPDDFVYFDPPYDPVSPTSSFVAYQKGGFSKEDQVALRDEALRLTELGVKVLLSNAATEFIQLIYGETGAFRMSPVRVNRTISASAQSRLSAPEYLIDNFQAVGTRA